MKILIAFLISTVIFLGLKVLRLGLKTLLHRSSVLNLTDHILAALELLVWMVFIFWTGHTLFSEKFFYSYLVYFIIFIIISFFSWFLLRDLLAGIVFRVRHNLRTGSYIKAGDFSGQVVSQKLSYLYLKTTDNQFLRIPYSAIINKVLTELTFPEEIESHLIHVMMDLSAGKISVAESLIRTTIFNSAWNNFKEEPEIKFLKENKEGYFFDIKLLSATPKQIKYIQMALEEIPSIHIL